MKLTTRGFTLVELMIVIAIIGILAAALFPSMTAYLKRSRDAARVAGTKDITTAVGAYFSDKERYPDHFSGYVNSGNLDTNYLPKGLPKDPTTGRSQGCGVALAAPQTEYFCYGSGLVSNNPYFTVIAYMENSNGGMTGAISTLTGSLTINPVTAGGLSKGAGAYYVITN